MRTRALWPLAAIVLAPAALSAGIVERAEAIEYRVNGKLESRVERDDAGHVTWLMLAGMSLSHDEVVEIGGLEHLKTVVFYQTNIKDADLTELKRCGELAHLNLTDTEITDAAIDTILELKSLKTVCLGNVKVTPEAVARLKQANRSRTHQLRYGYFERKR